MTTLLKHFSSKDTAIELLENNNFKKQFVAFWNIASLRIKEDPFIIGYGFINLKNKNEYKKIFIY